MIYLALPSRDGTLGRGMRTVLKHFERDFPANAQCERSLSLLCFNFNLLLADALNHRCKGITHFLLLHDDVIPQSEHWAAILLGEMLEHKLDAVAAVIPLRSDGGETSTSIDEAGPAGPGGIAGDPLRLKLGAVDGTLTSRTEPKLLINTGCLLIDIRKPWVEDRFYFRTHDEIVKNPDGTFSAKCISEDWLMSRWMAKRNIPFGATSKVKAVHRGTTEWPNWKESGATPPVCMAG